MSLLTSVESMSCGGGYEEFNLDMLSVIDDAISPRTVVNNGTHSTNFESTVNQPVQQRTTSKKDGNSHSKNTKKALQEGSCINLQPSQPSLADLTPAQDVMLSVSQYVPDQHANSLHFPDQELINVVPMVQAQAGVLTSPTPSTSSLTGSQLVEMMSVPKPPDHNGKHTAKPNYLTQCKSRLQKYQSDSMRNFADLFYMPFANETSFDSLESAEMQFALRKKVFDCIHSLNKHSQAVWKLEKTIYSCVLPLREKVGGVLPDNSNFFSVTPRCVNNALKRKRQEELDNCCDPALL